MIPFDQQLRSIVAAIRQFEVSGPNARAPFGAGQESLLIQTEPPSSVV